MPFVNIKIHAVWGTKRREHILTLEHRRKLFEHILQNARSKGIFIECINGYTDHVHCLISLNADMSVSKVIQLIKGESSFWANKTGLFSSRFEWADEYYAASVSQSNIDNVRRYIRNQEEHHRKISFEEEYNIMLEKIEQVTESGSNTE